MNLTQDEHVALTALRTEAESDNGNGWWDCYLDNAKPNDWTPRKWAAVLGSLTKKGLYRDIQDPDFKGIWGSVKMVD